MVHVFDSQWVSAFEWENSNQQTCCFFHYHYFCSKSWIQKMKKQKSICCLIFPDIVMNGSFELIYVWENEIHSFAFLFGDCCNTRLHLKDIVALSWPSIRTSAESFFFTLSSLLPVLRYSQNRQQQNIRVQVPAELYYNSTIVLNGSDTVLCSVLSDRIISDFFHATCHGIIMFLSSFIPKLVFIYS